METQPAVLTIPTFRKWVETETGLVHVLVDMLDSELQEFWADYLKKFFTKKLQFTGLRGKLSEESKESDKSSLEAPA
jgi:hypothetical protein